MNRPKMTKLDKKKRQNQDMCLSEASSSKNKDNMTKQTKATEVSHQEPRLHTIDRAGARLQTVEQVLVSSGSSRLDGRDNLCRECWVTVAQLGQLHRKRSQPATQNFTPSETTGGERQERLVCFTNNRRPDW